jgi:hypothetical protein
VFQQKSPGDWESVIEDVSVALRARAASYAN